MHISINSRCGKWGLDIAAQTESWPGVGKGPNYSKHRGLVAIAEKTLRHSSSRGYPYWTRNSTRK